VIVSGAHRADPGERGELVERPAVQASVFVPTPVEMRELGARLAAALRPGDLVVLSGALGAGKTTLTQGIGLGLGVSGAITSPTFVIARVHPADGGRPALVHVDAYRLGSLAEVDDLDLDATLQESITVVEWGEGLVEDLAAARLEIRLQRPRGLEGTGPDDPPRGHDEPRTVLVAGYGRRWDGVVLPLTG
jgi:tRNA threonylcarbamoyladenosine biosynthesis protein TsaE